LLVLEADSFVAAIAKGLVLRMAAAAQTYHRAPGQAKRLSGGIHDFKITFHAKRAVVGHSDSRSGHHSSSRRHTPVPITQSRPAGSSIRLLLNCNRLKKRVSAEGGPLLVNTALSADTLELKN
jgi:hypothetical protein